MAFIFPGLQTFTGPNGVPVSLGTVAFYIPGTTTFKDTFSDDALTVLNTNPVPLDAAGRASVWGSGSYRQIVKDALGNTIWDTTVETSVSAPALASTAGASMMGFLQSGTGAVAQTAEGRLRKFLLVTDFDTPQHAADALGSDGDLIFPGGVYTLTAPITFDAQTNIRLIGYGASIVAPTRFQSYFTFTGCTRFFVEGFGFDCGQTVLATYVLADYPNVYNVPVHFSASCNDVTVTNCLFQNLYTVAVYAKDSSNITVRNNEFRSPLQAQNLHLEFVSLQTVYGKIEVDNNIFLGTATTVNGKSPCAVTAAGVSAGSSLSIQGNVAYYCGRNNEGGHRLGVFDIYSDAENVTIRGNRSFYGREQFCRMSTTTNFEISENLAIVAAEADAYSLVSVESGAWPLVPHAVVIRGKIKDNNFQDPSHRQAYAIGLNAYDWGGGVVDIEVSGNKISGFDTAFYGQGPCDGVNIHHNRVDDVRMLVNWTMQDGGGTDLTFTTSISGGLTQAQSKVDELRVEDNVVNIRASSTQTPISISTNRTTAYTGTVGNIYVRRNTIACATPGTATAMNIYLNASVIKGRFYGEENYVDGYTTPYQLRSMTRASLKDNLIVGLTSLLNSGSSAYGTVEVLNNRSPADPLQGTAVLVTGTVTVATTQIAAGDSVELRRVSRGGTTGILSIGTITSGASFVINSTSATDTSIVTWEILR